MPEHFTPAPMADQLMLSFPSHIWILFLKGGKKLQMRYNLSHMKKIIILSGLIFGIFFSVSIADAHVVVKPSQVTPGAFQTFTMGVPVEKEIPTTGLRLVIPAGLNHVTPNVKPGWKITTKKEGENITEIAWTGGNIPAGQRDEFNFSAQIPAEEGTISWKAYQTYQDGMIVAWDKDAETIKNSGGDPLSETKIAKAVAEESKASFAATQSSTAFTFSLVALAFSIIAFVTTMKLKKASKPMV